MFKKSSLGLGTKIGAAANKPDLNVGCYTNRNMPWLKKYTSSFFTKKNMFHFIYF